MPAELVADRPTPPPLLRSPAWLEDVAIAVAAAVAIYAEFNRTWPGALLWDFGSFVASGQAAREGMNPYGIYPLTFRVSFPGFEAWNPNLNPPISALLFQLFGLADPHWMFRLWYSISASLYGLTVLLLVRRYAGTSRLVLALWACALAGFWDTLLLGQIYVPLVLAGTLAWLLLERGAGSAAGVMIGIVVALKPNFGVWPALLLLSGYFRPAVTSLAVAAAISAVPAIALGPEVYMQWFELIRSDSERAFFLTNASLSGLAARAGVPMAGLASSAILLAGAAVWVLVRRPNIQDVTAVALVVALLVSPLAWVHYTLFLLPVLFAKWPVNGMRVVAALLVVPVSFVVGQFGQPAWVQLTVGSIYNWALLFLLLVLFADDLDRSGFSFRWPFRRRAGASGALT